MKKALRFVLPSVCSQCAIFLFTIVDGVFVGRGVGTDALGAKGIYHDMASDYIFWCCAFTVPSSLAMLMQGFTRNDNAPVLVILSMQRGNGGIRYGRKKHPSQSNGRCRMR